MVVMVPTERKLAIKSYKELLPVGPDKSPCLSLPDWMVPLIKVSHFLHFFRKEMQLPTNMMEDIFNLLLDSHLDGAMDNIIVIRKIPKVIAEEESKESKENKYTKDWIL